MDPHHHDAADAPESPDATRVMKEARARSALVELHYETDDGDLVVARSRVLGLDEEHLYLDAPQSIGQPVPLRPRQRLEAFIYLGGTHYAFTSAVIGVDASIRLNDTKRVAGVVLRRPREVEERQRRAGFRVSVLGAEPIAVELHAALTDGSGACPVDARPYRGTLINLSVGGAAIRLENADGRNLAINELLFLRLLVPGDPIPFSFLAEVRQMWSIDRGAAIRAGLKIKPWPSLRDLRSTQQRLQRYLTAVQRRQLRRAG